MSLTVARSEDICRALVEQIGRALPAGFVVELLRGTDPDTYAARSVNGIALVAPTGARYEGPSAPTQRRVTGVRVIVGARSLLPDAALRGAMGYTEDVVAALAGYELRLEGNWPLRWYPVSTQPLFESAKNPGVFWCEAVFEAADYPAR